MAFNEDISALIKLKVGEFEKGCDFYTDPTIRKVTDTISKSEDWYQQGAPRPVLKNLAQELRHVTLDFLVPYVHGTDYEVIT